MFAETSDRDEKDLRIPDFIVKGDFKNNMLKGIYKTRVGYN